MRTIIVGLFLGLIFVGCGYKTDPVYVDDNKKVEK